jgi:hypothetical protein
LVGIEDDLVGTQRHLVGIRLQLVGIHHTQRRRKPKWMAFRRLAKCERKEAIALEAIALKERSIGKGEEAGWNSSQVGWN